MLTLFSVTKPFCGEFERIQRNAILSWSRLSPSCQILLLGTEEGLAEMAARVGATHLPLLQRNAFGTPLVNSIFAEAEKHAKFPTLCYINADIMLLSDFLPAVQRIQAWNLRSLIVGQRWDLDVNESVNGQLNWEGRLRKDLRTSGKLHARGGMDYFIFPRGLWGSIPPFSTGHCGYWDNWLIYRARKLGAPIVDATKCLTAVHQNHAHSYHAGVEAMTCWSTEKMHNYSLGGGFKHGYTLRDATHRLTRSGIKRRLVPHDLHRCLVLPVSSQSWARPLVRMKRALLRQTAVEETK